MIKICNTIFIFITLLGKKSGYGYIHSNVTRSFINLTLKNGYKQVLTPEPGFQVSKYFCPKYVPPKMEVIKFGNISTDQMPTIAIKSSRIASNIHTKFLSQT